MCQNDKNPKCKAASHQYSESVNMVQAAADLCKHIQNVLLFEFASFGVLDQLHSEEFD